MKTIKQIRHIPYLNKSGTIESILPLEVCIVNTAIGSLIPIYYTEDHGRKKLTPVKFHKNGTVRSISLQTARLIQTPIGSISAELITFYPDGALNKIFPLNGKLSGYWSEIDEYKLAKKITISTSVGILKVKPINIQFFETGELKSLTLWPQEKTLISTKQGEWSIKSGISFHKDGTLATCEPEKPVSIKTPIGAIKAYDPDPNGMCGEKNSLSFSEKGEVLGCSSVESMVKVVDADGTKYSFQPRLMRSHCNDEEYILEPLKIEFHKESMVFKNGFTTCGKLLSTSSYYLEDFHSEIAIARQISCN